MEQQVPVLIVGGSLVGLTTSMLLGRHGVRHILVERHRGTAIHPRAAAFHQRTMEIFRDGGVQQAVEQAADKEFVQDGSILSVDSLGGNELAYYYRSMNEGVEHLSPARRLFITQIGLEPVLRAHAAALGADLRYATELLDFTQDEQGVVATIRPRDGGDEQRIRARYLIGADGAHSPVRRALGIKMEGRGDFAQCATIYFKADFRALLRGRNMSVVYVNQPGQLAFFRFAITGDAGFLAVFATFDEQGRPDNRLRDGLTSERAVEMVRAALGVPADFPVSVENIQPWTATAATAAAFRKGNAFLAGDAAHLMPPTGGFGGNTGVADAHNLAWKIAMVLDGRADPALLDSYEAERRPMAALTVEQAYRRYVERVDPSLPADDLADNLSDTAIELGAVYHSDALVGPDRDTVLTQEPDDPSGRVGVRLAHHWIEKDGRRCSTLDLAGPGFTLLAGPGGKAWVEAAGGIEGLACHRFTSASDAAAVALPEGGALLLRPDAVIGWRSGSGAQASESALTDALRRLTGRTA